MKKVFIRSLVAAALALSCQKKTLPVITERKADPPRMIVNVYPPPETMAPDTLAGRQIFITRCSRCHSLPQRVQYPADRWDKILPVMIPRARMDNKEALHLRAYVLAGAAKY